MTFRTLIDIDDVFSLANFGGDRSRRGGVAGGEIMLIPIVLIGRPYNTQAISCECEIADIWDFQKVEARIFFSQNEFAIDPSKAAKYGNIYCVCTKIWAF